MHKHTTGTCTMCGKENCDLIILDDVDWICEQCLDSAYQKCDICGEYYDGAYVEFVYLKSDGRAVCEYCREDFDDDDVEE